MRTLTRQCIRIALSSGVTLLAALPSYADDFCDGLDTVIATVPTNFASIRGEARKSDPRFFDRPFVIAGARPISINGAACYVTRLAGTTPEYSYECDFPGPTLRADIRPAMSTFAARVSACLHIPNQSLDLSAPSDRNPLASSNLGPYRLPVAGVSLDVGLMFPPDGGQGTFYVRIAGPG